MERAEKIAELREVMSAFLSEHPTAPTPKNYKHASGIKATGKAALFDNSGTTTTTTTPTSPIFTTPYPIFPSEYKKKETNHRDLPFVEQPWLLQPPIPAQPTPGPSSNDRQTPLSMPPTTYTHTSIEGNEKIQNAMEALPRPTTNASKREQQALLEPDGRIPSPSKCLKKSRMSSTPPPNSTTSPWGNDGAANGKKTAASGTTNEDD